jgi:hypothetical protein
LAGWKVCSGSHRLTLLIRNRYQSFILIIIWPDIRIGRSAEMIDPDNRRSRPQTDGAFRAVCAAVGQRTGVRAFPNDSLATETSASLIGRLGSGAFRPSRPCSSPYSYVQDRRPTVSSLCKTSGSNHPESQKMRSPRPGGNRISRTVALMKFRAAAPCRRWRLDLRAGRRDPEQRRAWVRNIHRKLESHVSGASCCASGHAARY